MREPTFCRGDRVAPIPATVGDGPLPQGVVTGVLPDGRVEVLLDGNRATNVFQPASLATTQELVGAVRRLRELEGLGVRVDYPGRR
jgi:hypothetical protein